MMTLEDGINKGRYNNLNLIRLIAAYAVLISHSYAIYTGDPSTEPLRSSTGFSLGGIAVWIFFGVSGLLISQSWDRSTASKFVAARSARIMPALIASAIATLLVGAFVTSLPVCNYWMQSETISYLPRFVTMIFMRDSLPGVFEQNQFPRSVNGSAWTLFYEVGCYAIVFAAGMFGRRIKWAMHMAIAIIFALWLAVEVLHLFTPATRLAHFTKLGFPFALGMLLYRLRSAVPLNLLISACFWLLAWLLADTVFYSTIFVAGVVYATFYIGYAVKGFLWYNGLGDVSYGVYIYAFTIQQLVIYLMPGVSLGEFIAVVTVIVLPISYLSWILVEAPSIARAKLLERLIDAAFVVPFGRNKVPRRYS